MKRIISIIAVIALIVGFVSCEREELKVKTPNITTLSSENGANYTVILSGKISGLDAVALDFQPFFFVVDNLANVDVVLVSSERSRLVETAEAQSAENDFIVFLPDAYFSQIDAYGCLV